MTKIGHVIGEIDNNLRDFLPIADDEYMLKNPDTGRIFLCYGDEDAACEEIAQIIAKEAQ